MASLVDTNVLVCRIDPRDPAKQRKAEEIMRAGLLDDSVALAHQCIVEFVAAATRPRKELGGAPLLSPEEARVQAERLTAQFPVLYPNREVLLTALRGTAMYGLAWSDAHLWAHAEAYGVEEILSEDFEHGRHYGAVRVVNPFLAAGGVHDLPPLYDAPSAPGDRVLQSSRVPGSIARGKPTGRKPRKAARRR